MTKANKYSLPLSQMVMNASMLLLTVLWYQLSISVKNNPDQNKQADEDVLPITEI